MSNNIEKPEKPLMRELINEIKQCNDALKKGVEFQVVARKIIATHRLLVLSRWYGYKLLQKKIAEELEHDRVAYGGVLKAAVKREVPDDVFDNSNYFENHTTNIRHLANGHSKVPRFMNTPPTTTDEVNDDKVRQKFAQLYDKLSDALNMTTPSQDVDPRAQWPGLSLCVVAINECTPICNANAKPPIPSEKRRVVPQIVVLSHHEKTIKNDTLRTAMDAICGKLTRVQSESKTELERNDNIPFSLAPSSTAFDVTFAFDKEKFLSDIFDDKYSDEPSAKKKRIESDDNSNNDTKKKRSDGHDE